MLSKFISGFAIYILFLCQQVSAAEAYGGSLRSPEGDLLSVACDTQETGTEECQNFDLYVSTKWDRPAGVGHKIGSFTTEEMGKISTLAGKISHKHFELIMRNVYIVPTALTLLFCTFKIYVGCPLILPAAIFDISKAPLVLAAHGILEIKDLATRQRFLRYMRYLVNPEKKGKIKKIKNRDFDGLIAASR